VKIDAFAHISPIRYLERVEDILASPGAPPIEELGDPAVTSDLARFANDEMAGLVRGHDRFVGFAAALPLNDVDAGLERLPHEPLEYFRRFYADTVLFGAARAALHARLLRPRQRPLRHGHRRPGARLRRQRPRGAAV